MLKFHCALTLEGVELVKLTAKGTQPVNVSATKLVDGAGFTTIVVVEAPEQDPGISYVIVNEPGPETLGSNSPVVAFTIPVPDQFPPGLAAERVTAVAFAQKGPAAVIAVEVPEFIITFVVAEAVHELTVIVTV